MEFFMDGLRKYADFEGRANRQQFWMYVLIYMAIYLAIGAVGYVLGTGLLTSLFSIVMLLPSISITCRRLHDTGRSGWWQLIGLVPVIGLIVMIVFTVQDSDGDNSYGAKPA